MAQVADVKTKAVRQLEARLKEIKQTDEADLSKIAAEFDSVSEIADQVAAVFERANEALSPGEQQTQEQPQK